MVSVKVVVPVCPTMFVATHVKHGCSDRFGLRSRKWLIFADLLEQLVVADASAGFFAENLRHSTLFWLLGQKILRRFVRL